MPSKKYDSSSKQRRNRRGTPRTSVDEFKKLLKNSNRILALCGAGLSAASGLPTFRGAGGLWRNHAATSLATPEAFNADPALVWLFYAWRRHMARRAQPNPAHYALAELGKANENFLCLTQNVDGLSPRAGHPASALRALHGNVFDLKCVDGCGYSEPNVTRDPLCPALAPAAEDYPADQVMPLLDPKVPTPKIERKDLPQCPNCKRSGRTALLRPGVVWFGEALPEGLVEEADAWVAKDRIDVMLVIGTSAAVYPAAGYVDKAKRRGAVVAVINPDPAASQGLEKNDYFFEADAAVFLPLLLEDIIGKLEAPRDGEP